ncbi:hypothetical protein [Kibdelosporangium aridum]|uniref:hypothetical protein n=1 Tax=Kibdelosporangium aridum TaxID=2030 RepID=UPI0035EC0DA5
MALRRLLADPFTRSELGREGLEELSRNLWPGRCQTCGDQLGEDAPAVVVDDFGETVTATLHHAACQEPRWAPATLPSMQLYLSTTLCLAPVPFGDPSEADFWPTVLANPSLEQVSLRRDQRDRFRAATVDIYREMGLVRPPVTMPVANNQVGIRSWLTETQLIVQCGTRFWMLSHGNDPVAESYLAEIRRRRGVALGVSTALDPLHVEDPEPIKRVMRAGDVALTFAPLCTSEPAPQLTGNATIVDSEFVGADESRDTDWLGGTRYFRKPTYDPATGRFETGMGMDGPFYWTLNTPGVRVENGLIVGPPEIGKTNALRILLIEALCSGLFQYIVADPLNHNLVDVLGKSAYATATTPRDTIHLLRAVASMVDQTPAAPYRDPSPTAAGLVVAVDDAHAVLTDPAVARLAERIATAGPTKGVGLVVATRSLDLVGFGGNHALVRALAERNAMAFGGLEQFDALRRLKEGAGQED